MRVSTRTLAALLIGLATATGCGGGATVREQTGAFNVTLDDYLIRPQSIRVPKDRQLTVTVHNAGKLGHTDSEVVSLTGAYHNLLRMWAEV